ncbi:ABC transporter permease [Archangium violaceum]|uniref:ABC transporter permease n=1 Tax=Archangium violaceum TaxID=83451 RepID=UPI0019512F81|nr:ABC transporter permease [Archangium violaceum]QRN98456.1 ABC transporter permease [Archangium violaceum]
MKALLTAVFRKEMRDHLRDRRSVTSVLAGSLVGPILFAVMFTVIASWNRQDKPLELPVVGRANAPSLMAYLERSGAKLSEAPADYESRIQAGTLDAVLIVPEDYGKDFAAGRSAKVQLVMDNSRNKARATIKRTQALLNQYSGSLGTQRLLARGVAPELAMPVRVEEVDLSTPERLAASILNMIPIFLVMACFIGGLNVAIDTMAGERERGSLESLLLNPVERGTLVLGKWLSTTVFSCITVVVVSVAFTVVAKRIPLQDLGVKVSLEPATALAMVGAVVPMALLSSAAQMLVSTFARSYKEAQTYLQLLMMLPTLPGMVLALSPIQSKMWMYGVPVLGQQLLVSELMRGESLGVLPFVLSTVGCLVLTALCLTQIARLLSDERIVFGRS